VGTEHCLKYTIFFPAVSDKFRLCFEFGICTEEDIQASRQLVPADGAAAATAAAPPATAAAVATTVRAPRSGRTTAPPVRSDHYAELKVSQRLNRIV
jgi:hypothetical protein